MGTTSLTVCAGCNRHVRCGERACPFCGAAISSFACVLEYRIKTRLDRGRAFSLGAALTAAGFASSCDDQPKPLYGVACTTTSICTPTGGSGASSNGAAGAELGGAAISGGTAGASANGGTAGAVATGGNAAVAGSGGAGTGGEAAAGGNEAGGAESGAGEGGGSLAGAAGASGAGGT